jgi:hypothetical protein
MNGIYGLRLTLLLKHFDKVLPKFIVVNSHKGLTLLSNDLQKSFIVCAT